MMKCDYKNREGTIADYLMYRLSDEEATKFQEHFFNCDICFQELQLQRSAVNLIKAEGKTLFEDYLEERDKETFLSRLRRSQFKKALSFQENRVIFGGVALAIIVLVACLFLFKVESEPELLATIEYSADVPYAYHPPDMLRRGEGELPDAVRSFNYGFSIAMLAYKDREYETAIRNLQAIQPQADDLVKTMGNNERALAAVSQYYFYLGLAHLAVTRDKEIDLTQAGERDHLEKAAQCLLKSHELGHTPPFITSDVYSYFLGVTYGFSGKHELAVEQLGQIQQDSPYYEKASVLGKKWSHDKEKGGGHDG